VTGSLKNGIFQLAGGRASRGQYYSDGNFLIYQPERPGLIQEKRLLSPEGNTAKTFAHFEE
jgi:hypothetical protein